MRGRVCAPTSPEAEKAVLRVCPAVLALSVPVGVTQRPAALGSAPGFPWLKAVSMCSGPGASGRAQRKMTSVWEPPHLTRIPPIPLAGHFELPQCRVAVSCTISVCDGLLHFICLPVCSLAAPWAWYPDSELCVRHHTVLFLGSPSSLSVILKMLITG